MLERLQKILSQHGIASRRHAEEFITAGRVKVNGKVTELGQKADPSIDRIEVDGKPLSANIEKLYYLMNKPLGYVTTNLDEGTWKEQHVSPRAETRGRHRVMDSSPLTMTPGPQRIRQTVRELLPRNLRGKVFPVGRLDKDTSGLLLFTNDGDLAYKLTHPKFPHEREYLVDVSAPIEEGALIKLERGVALDGSKTKPAKFRRISPTRFHLIITEGRNRQVRRMCSKVGAEVVHLARMRIQTLQDASLQAGTVRALTDAEIRELKQAIGIA